jgi:hypothetical protein
MFGMIGRVDPIEKVAEMASDIASLTQPHHTPPSNFACGSFYKFETSVDCRTPIDR